MCTLGLMYEGQDDPGPAIRPPRQSGGTRCHVLIIYIAILSSDALACNINE